MKWRDVYANSLANQPPDPAQRPVLDKPRVISKGSRQEGLEGPSLDWDDESDDDGDEEADESADDDVDNSPTAAAAERSSAMFNVGEHIDVTSAFLLDLLSDTAIHSKQTSQPTRSSLKRPAISSTPSLPLEANEWF